MAVKVEQINRRWRRFSSLGDFPLSLSSFDKNQMVWLCVTFKFVCFDGIEGKKLVDEVIREREKGRKKIKKERERKRALWNVLEFGGSGREKRGKKEKKKRVRVRVWRRKKEEKKGGSMDEKK